MENISIGYFADGPWSHEAFNLLRNDGSISIKFIVPRADTDDNTLMNYAQNYNIDYLPNVRINSKEFYNAARKYNCDLFVSMSFNQIFRTGIINLPRLKTINCHAGKLPFYRGRNVLNWVLINDEKEFGITVHYIDEGIDTGDIILQRIFPITDKDDYSRLLKKAYKECAEILYDAIKIIQKNEVSIIKQHDIHEVGFYCGQRIYGDEIINWDQESRNIYNFVRALCRPGPIATTFSGVNEVRINRVKEIVNAPWYVGIPGQVLSKSQNGFFVKTKDSFIEVLEFEGKIRVGDRLTSKLHE
jgi:methionyl-tRNA formyltransferase